MAKRTVTLIEPVELHGQKITEISLREPKGGTYLDLGEPRFLSQTKDGSLFWVDNEATIKAYLEATIEGDHGPVVLRLLGLADVRAAKETILSFFTDADQANFARK